MRLPLDCFICSCNNTDTQLLDLVSVNDNIGFVALFLYILLSMFISCTEIAMKGEQIFVVLTIFSA